MERRRFLQILGLAVSSIVTAPILLLKEKQNVICFDGTTGQLDCSTFDYHYDFTNPEYGIYNSRGEIVGWKDTSGNGRDFTLVNQ
jgi:hypothetical protein